MPNPLAFAERLELFFGEAYQGEARVYARVAGMPGAGPWRIGGQLTGPECRFSHTLRATIPFRPLRGASVTPGEALLAEAILPDPCFWTPAVPLLYRARIELCNSEREMPKAQPVIVERLFGIRRLGPHGRSFFLDGERWVPRGVQLPQASLADLPVAREAKLLLYLPAADDDFYSEASQIGVPLAIELRSSEHELEQEIRRLAKWPAVFFAVIDSGQQFDFDPRQVARNLLFAVRIRGDEPTDLSAWAHAVWCEIGAVNGPLAAATTCNLPIIVSRRREPPCDLATGRSACDRLQYDLAPAGDFAGYVA
jgi:hypothetical protein